MNEGNINIFSGFGKTLATLQKLTRMESAISTLINKSKIPPLETRKLLRCANAQQASNTPLFQFMVNVFKQIGLGDLSLEEIERFKLTFKIVNSPVTKLYQVTDRKTCYITIDAISQFFSHDLGLPCNVEEKKCVNEGKDWCEFEVSLQPLPVYKIALDEEDKKLLSYIVENKWDEGKLAESMNTTIDDVNYRMDILKSYHVLDQNGKPTDIGITYHEYGGGLLGDGEENFPPPWDSMSKITSAISAAESFAEAFSETVESNPPKEIARSEVINLADEAKKSQSFAELVSNYIKDKDEDE